MPEFIVSVGSYSAGVGYISETSGDHEELVLTLPHPAWHLEPATITGVRLVITFDGTPDTTYLVIWSTLEDYDIYDITSQLVTGENELEIETNTTTGDGNLFMLHSESDDLITCSELMLRTEDCPASGPEYDWEYTFDFAVETKPAYVTIEHETFVPYVGIRGYKNSFSWAYLRFNLTTGAAGDNSYVDSITINGTPNGNPNLEDGDETFVVGRWDGNPTDAVPGWTVDAWKACGGVFRVDDLGWSFASDGESFYLRLALEYLTSGVGPWDTVSSITVRGFGPDPFA